MPAPDREDQDWPCSGLSALVVGSKGASPRLMLRNLSAGFEKLFPGTLVLP